MKGEPLGGQATQLLYVDKGTTDGVSNGIKGYFPVHHGVAMLEFVVVAVTKDRAVLRGWYIEEIASGTKLVLNVGGVGSRDIWRYFDPEPTPLSTDQVSSKHSVFMARVYPPYKLGDWSRFSAEVAASADWRGQADQLLEAAQLSTKQGIEELGSDWSNYDMLSAADLVRLALAIIAAGQGALAPEAAVLEESQKEKLADIWDMLYVVSLSLVGSEGDPEPMLAEPQEKLEAALHVARLSGDNTRMLLSQVGLAWLDERTGGRFHWEHRKESEQMARALSLWPPVLRQSGELVILHLQPND